jgi:hypothetical protein
MGNSIGADIVRKLIGASAVLSPERTVVDVDVDGLIRRLLLFDKYVLASVRLKEFPLLAKYLRFEGLRDLLAAKLIEVRCECLQLAQVGQSGQFGDRVLPLFSYKFDWFDAHDRPKYIRDCLMDLHSVPTLQRKQVSKLKRAIDATIQPLPREAMRAQLFPVFQNELLHNQSLVRASIEMTLRKRLGLNDAPFSLAIHQDALDIFVVETDLHHRARISELEGHKIVESGIMGVAGLTQSIGEMKYYSAISGFRDEELPLFRNKLDFLASTASSQSKENSFRRVIDISGLPQFSAEDGAINVERLLKIRDTPEAREFRDWLGGIGQSTDKEIEDRVAGLRTKAGLKVGSDAGKAMRFLATWEVGLVSPILTTTLVGLLDQFLLDKLLPPSGIAAFVNELYPSIFESRDKP